MNVWIVRAGRNGEYEEMALNLGITSIDWNELEDISYIHNRDDLKNLYKEVYPDESKNKIAASVGQIWSFINKIRINDVIIMPLKHRPGFSNSL
jgi:restriction system protein